MPTTANWRFARGDRVVIAGGGRFTPATVLRRARYADGTENYRVRFEVAGTGYLSWILADDLMTHAQES